MNVDLIITGLIFGVIVFGLITLILLITAIITELLK